LIVAVAPAVLRHRPLVDLPSPLQLGESLLFLDGHVQLLNSSFWTLMVEFRWYFAFPFLLALWLKSPRAFCTVALTCVVLYHFTRAHGLDLGTLPGFMLGIIAADVHIGARLRGDIAERIRRFALPLSFVCAIAGVAVESHAWIPGFDNADVQWAYQPTILGWQLATFFFVVASGAIASLGNLLSSKILVATGVASYAIYLMHEPIVTIVLGITHGIGSFVLAFVAALTAGFTFWVLAERPFTTGRLRQPLLRLITPLLTRACAFFGLPQTIEATSARRTSAATLLMAPRPGARRSGIHLFRR
jgi:peptidoglycan/LPS O-acetylase OafA/YrhL